MTGQEGYNIGRIVLSVTVLNLLIKNKSNIRFSWHKKKKKERNLLKNELMIIY